MSPHSEMDRIREATLACRAGGAPRPRGDHPGTGWGAGGAIEVDAAIDYEDLPHFPVSTVVTHQAS